MLSWLDGDWHARSSTWDQKQNSSVPSHFMPSIALRCSLSCVVPHVLEVKPHSMSFSFSLKQNLWATDFMGLRIIHTTDLISVTADICRTATRTKPKYINSNNRSKIWYLRHLWIPPMSPLSGFYVQLALPRSRLGTIALNNNSTLNCRNGSIKSYKAR